METSQKESIKQSIALKYSWLNDSDIERAFNIALADYLLYKYPSDNNRPSPETLVVSFTVEQWILERMDDVLDRAGASYISYRENGLSWEYAQSHIDRALIAKLMPKAATPQ